jgi:flagellar motility protein MotE (MotC chaperone)
MDTEMKSKKKMVNVILIIAVLTFAVGFGLGYYVFAYQKNDKKDYKQSLREVISYITEIENKNTTIEKELAAMRGEVNPNGVQTVGSQERISSLERENSALRTAMSQSQSLMQQNMELRGQIQNLQAQLGASRPGGIPQQIPMPQVNPQQMQPQAQPSIPQPVR